MTQLKIPAVYMRGGTSKGLFFRDGVLPDDPKVRDAILLRSLGSPDPFGRQVDGLGGATSSTSKAVIVSPSARSDSDVDYLFAQVSINTPIVDYSGNCGNLSSAVGPFAIEEGLVAATEGRTTVRIWQVNTQKRIIAHVPTQNGLPVVTGDYEIDGVPNPGAEICLEFLDPGGTACHLLLPTGRVIDQLNIPGLDKVNATLIDAGMPTIIVRASELGLEGHELQETINNNPKLLAQLEAIRSHGAVAMGLATEPQEITQRRPGTPKIAFVAPARDYVSSKGQKIAAESIDLIARIISMGKLHQAYAITGAIATVVAAAIPGTVANHATDLNIQGERGIRVGHPAGIICAGAEVCHENDVWVAKKATVSRTARRLMEGFVRIPVSEKQGAAVIRQEM